MSKSKSKTLENCDNWGTEVLGEAKKRKREESFWLTLEDGEAVIIAMDLRHVPDEEVSFWLEEPGKPDQPIEIDDPKALPKNVKKSVSKVFFVWILDEDVDDWFAMLMKWPLNRAVKLIEMVTMNKGKKIAISKIPPSGGSRFSSYNIAPAGKITNIDTKKMDSRRFLEGFHPLHSDALPF